MSVRDDLILDIRQAQSSIDALAKQITGAVSGIAITLDTGGVKGELDALTARLAGETVGINVDANTAGVPAEIRRAVDGVTTEVGVTADTSSAEQELDKFRREQTEKNKRTDLGIGDAIGGAALLAGLNKLIDGAAQGEQAVGGLEVVFGSAADEVDRFNTNAAKLAGLSTTLSRQLTTGLGGALKGLGFDIEDAADQSVALVQIAADLSATYGGSTRQAVEAVGAAMRGEFESLEQFNIFLTQAKVDGAAVALGLTNGAGAVDTYGRAQASLKLIFDQSAASAGQFARELDTASGQAAVSAAERADAAAELGETLLPLYIQLNQVASVAATGIGALPGPIQSAGIALLALGVAARPVTAGIEALGAGAGLLRTRLGAMEGGIFGLTSRVGPLALELGLLYGALQLVNETADKADLSKLERQLVGLGDSGVIGGEIADTLGEDFDKLSHAIERIAAPSVASQAEHVIYSLGRATGDTADDLSQARQKIDDLDKALASLAGSDPDAAAAALDAILGQVPSASAERLPGLLDDYAGALTEVDTEQRDAGYSAGTLGRLQKEAEVTAAELREEIDKLTTAFEAQFDAIDSRLDLENSYRDALINVSDAQADLAETRRQVNAGEIEGADATRALRDAQIDLDDATSGVAEAAAAMRVNQIEATGATVDAQEKARILAEEYRTVANTLDVNSPLRARLLALAGELETVSAAHTVNIETAAAEEALDRLFARLANLQSIGLGTSADAAQLEKWLGPPRRHTGGRVLAGNVYVTGGIGAEELFVPDSPGTIVNPSDTRRILAEITSAIASTDRLATRMPTFGVRPEIEERLAAARNGPAIDYDRLARSIANEFAKAPPESHIWNISTSDPIQAASEAARRHRSVRLALTLR